jgi:cytochrome P450
VSVLAELDGLRSRLGHDLELLGQREAHMVQTWATTRSDRLFAELRAHRPIVLVGKTALLTKYDDIVEVLGNDAVFSVRLYDDKLGRTSGPVLLDFPVGPLRDRDAPILHAAIRQDDLPRLAQNVAAAAHEYLQPFLATGRLDAVAQYAHRLPIRVVGEYFGVPGPDEATMTRWNRPIFQDIFVNLQDSEIERDAAIAAAQEFRAYIAGLIEQRHAEMAAGKPTPDDVLGRWLQMQAAGQDTFDDAHIPNNFIGMMMGGLDSIATAITHVIYELLQHPDAYGGARQAVLDGDDALVDRYTREALRFRPQDTALYRYTETDHTVAAGTGRARRIPAGTKALVVMASAMMDEERIEAPREFRVDRPDSDYLHFGYGLHQCLGRYIARVHMREATKALLRLENLRAVGDLEYDGIYPRSLIVEFDPPATGAAGDTRLS